MIKRNVSSEIAVAGSQHVKERDYWTNKYSQKFEKSRMPHDVNKYQINTRSMQEKVFEIDGALFERLNKISNNSDIRLHMILTTILLIIIEKYTDSNDVSIGMPIFKQEHEENIQYVNTVIPMRMSIDRNNSFKECLYAVKKILFEAVENQNYPMDALIYELGLEYTKYEYPLFDIVVLLENIQQEEYIEHTKPNVIFSFLKTDTTIHGRLIYNSILYNDETIERIIRHYVTLTNNIVNNVNTPIGEIDLLSPQEKETILLHFNDIKKETGDVCSIYQLFEKQVAKTPDNIAIQFMDKKLTYSELNEKANRLAGKLCLQDIEKGKPVVILAERSLEMIIGILGILKTGGCYVPIDCECPEDRTKYIVEDSGATIILTQKNLLYKVNCAQTIILLDTPEAYSESIENLTVRNDISDLAYIIYTSGSTGKPKGVAVEHKSIFNTLLWRKEYYQFTCEDVILQIPSFAFDSSVEDIFTPLISGAKLVIMKQESRFNLEYLSELLIRHKITHFLITPAFYKTLLDEIPDALSNLRIVTIAGDNFTKELVKEHFTSLRETRLVNEYGPTENSVCTSVYEFQADKTGVLIGKPINNIECYILNKNRDLCPIGVAGELCVSGKGLARGYFGNTELTNQKYIINPYRQGERMYCTGDLVRWLPDGNMEFMGRIDYQVKIRGFRIELGEIENCLLKCDSIKEAYVMARDGEDGNKYLIAYFIADTKLDITSIRLQLLKELPDYMIPVHIIQLEYFPLTSNGKVDRMALPEPSKSNEYEEPANEIEEKLTQIWCKILSKEKIGVNSNFFEMGGHSLRATILISNIRKEFQIEFPLREVFERSTIRQQAEYIQNSEKCVYTPIRKTEKRNYYPSTPAQKRMYILNQMEGISVTYNVPIGLVINGILDEERVENAIRALIARHDSLRTAFELIDGEPYQRIYDEVEFHLSKAFAVEKNAEEVVQGYVRQFDLTKAPLLHAALVMIDNKRSILLLDMHHIVSDGVSMDILVREFASIYEEKELLKQKLQYKDYTVWQEENKDLPAMVEQEKFWLNYLKGDLPQLNLPTDYPRPVVQSYEGDKIPFEIDEILSEKLRCLANDRNATLFMLVVAAYNVLLSKYSGQEDIIVGSPIAGRAHPDVENIVGMFVNSLAIRNFPKGDLRFSDFLINVRDRILQIYENQEYPFNDLVNKLDVCRDMSRNPIFDTMLVMQNMNIPGTLIDGNQYNLQDYEGKISKFDLTLMLLEKDGKIECSFQYCTRLFNKKTIEHISKHFINILNQITEDSNVYIKNIQMLSEDERNQILYHFNDTKRGYEDKTIHELFQQQVKLHQDKICVVSADDCITYGELNEQANKLANALRNHDVTKGSIVGVMIEKSINMIVSLLAVLKTGAVYLPIDPAYPNERVRYMLEDSKAAALLTLSDAGDHTIFNGLTIDVGEVNLNAYGKEDLEQNVEIDDLAYIIYTSGSTGKPKGVMIGHRGIASLKEYFIHEIEISESDHILQFASCSFDASVWEIFMALLTGASLYLVPRDSINNFRAFEKYLNDNEITVATLPPIYLASLKPESVHTLKRLITAGSSAQVEVADQWKDQVTYINAYGPTETTICATTYTYQESNIFNKVPIGKPVYNAQVYILDTYNNVQPIGVCGELCVSGDIIAHGYLSNVELTKKCFIDNPFIYGQKMYKTGDYAKWLPNGDIEYIGRMDQQIKIRGYRVELGEVETVMLSFKSIQQAAAIAIDDSKESKSLVGFYIADDEISKVELREFMLKRLPDYMTPSYLVQVDQMPLTSSGKLDAKALSDFIEEAAATDEYVAPKTEVEMKVAKIWMKVLNRQQIGIYDNFFLVGGDSISMMKIISELTKEFKVDIGFREYMEAKTLSALAAIITQKLGTGITKTYHKVRPDKNNRYEPFPLTDVQMAYLVGRDESFDIGGIGTHIYTEVEYKLDIVRFITCVQKVIRRHPMLRAVIYENGTQQILKDVPEYNVVVEDISHMNALEKMKYIEQNRTRMSHQVFVTDQWPLFEIKAMKIDKNQEIYLLCGSIDALIADGSSLQLAIADGVQYYQNPDIVLPEIEFTFRDYIIANEDFKKSDIYKQDKEYWMNKRTDFPLAPELPLKCEPEAIKKPHFSRHSKVFEKEQWLRIKEKAKIEKVTPSALLCTVYAYVLSKWSNQSELTVNLTVYSRLPFHEEAEKVVGDFTSVVLVAVRLDKKRSFWDNARSVQKVMLDSLEHRHYDGVNFSRDIIQYNNLSKQKAVMPYVFTSVLYNNGKNMFDELDPDKIKMGISQTSQVYIDNQVSEVKGCLSINWDYVDQLIDANIVDTMFQQYTKIISSLLEVENINIEIGSYDSEIIREFNNTRSDKKLIRLDELFKEQEKVSPDKIALEFGEEKVSYRELGQMSNQVAHYLIKQGVKRGDYVGVLSCRSIFSIVNILGVLKSGAAYVPIDVDYPDVRKEYILENCGCNLVIDSTMHEENLFIDYSMEEVQVESSIDDTAYVIYTSGSTGKPKGVVITHRSAVNTIIDINERYHVNETDKLIGLSSMCFDLSVYDIFGSLSTGATLVLIKDVRNVNDIMNVVFTNQVTIWNSVPAIMDLSIGCLEKECNHLRLVMLSGDWIPLKLPEKIMLSFKNAEVISLGGATEASIWSIYYPIKEVNKAWKSIPYGYPLTNQTFYVLDYNMEICPIGVQGELYIGGDGVASGYVNDKEKTDKAFIQHPMYGRIYKTGDYGILKKEGWIEFRGRQDQQVKIGGFRIELGEIESSLMEYKEIQNAVVIDRLNDTGKKYLCAYYVSKQEYDTSAMREFLLTRLPEYMLPLYYINIQEIPVTSNGKVNKKALPLPDLYSPEDIPIEKPANPLELRLVDLFKETIKIDKMGVTINFFELGINSIDLMQLKNAISKNLGVDISFKDILKADNIRSLAVYLSNKDNRTKEVLVSHYTSDPVHRYEKFPLTDLQFAYLMGRENNIELGGIGTHSYVEIKTKIDMQRFNKSLQKLIIHQPMLHTLIYSDGQQQVMENIPEYNIPIVDLSKISEKRKEEYLLKERAAMSHYVFQPDQFPLFDFRAYKISEETHYLFVGFDLLIADGASMLIMTKELLEFYKNPDLELPEINFTFRDYVLASNKFKESEKYYLSKQFWQNKLPNFPLAPALPIIQEPHEVKKPHFKRLSKKLSESEWSSLKQIARINNVTTSALLCTIYAKVLSIYSNQPRLALNLTVFNRPNFHEDVNRMIGDFTSIIILDVDFSYGGSLIENAVKVRNTMLEDLEYSSYDGVEFIRDISRYHKLGNSAVMPVVFTSMLFSLEGDGNEQDNAEFWGEVTMGISQTPQVYIDHQVAEDNGMLSLTWDYVEELFDAGTIHSMFKLYTTTLLKLIEEDSKNIKMPVCGNEIVKAYNQTEKEIPPCTLDELFEEQVDANSDKAAVIFENNYITYKELDEKSNQIAHFLIDKGVVTGDCVGVITKRCIETIVNIMGIVKAGGAYVPVSPDYPEDRKKYIVSNSSCKYVLEPDTWDKNDIDSYMTVPIEMNHRPSDKAYIIYTSGSTGKPKGVVISHKGVVNTILDINQKFDITSEDKILGLSSMCFDLSVYDIFGSLCSGASLILIHDVRDMEDIRVIMEKEQITVWNSVPAVIDMFIENMKADRLDQDDVGYWRTGNMKNLIVEYDAIDSLRVVMLSGDWIPLFLPDKIREYFPSADIYSLGGATEASIWSIYYKIEKIDSHYRSIPYGYPLSNQRFYVLDYEMNICPIGVQGELYIGGDGLALCYLNDEDKTNSTFIIHPEFGRLYKTGDYGIMHQTGYIEFLGRKDFQVKIRGHRIELGEIENVIMGIQNVKNCVVIDQTDSNNRKVLCTYVVSENTISSDTVRDVLLKKLPDYMIPQYIINIDVIPLTSNGKIDRKSLPNPFGEKCEEKKYIGPRNETEEKVQKVWQHILGIPQISVIDNYFMIGGDSVKAMQIILQLSKDYQISINDIFAFQTIREISNKIVPKQNIIQQWKEQIEGYLTKKNTVNKEEEEYWKECYKEYDLKILQDDIGELTEQADYHNILITGGTGYLGIHLIYEILTNTMYKIYTIVRANTEEDAMHRLQNKFIVYFGNEAYSRYQDRIHVIKGDITLPKLGINEKIFDDLTYNIDCIIHAAATVKHFGKYDEFNKVNVQGTSRIIEFAALNKKKDVHYISTKFIADGTMRGKPFMLLTEYDYDLSQMSDNYYIQSKLEAEKIVIKARASGLNTCVYRVGNIVFDTESGRFQENAEENAFYNILRAFIKIERFPQIQLPVQYDFSYVDYVRKAIVKLFDRKNLKNEIYHIFNPKDYGLTEIGELIRESGFDISIESFDTFWDYLRQSYNDEKLKPYIDTILMGAISPSNKNQTYYKITSKRTCEILQSLGFTWCDMTQKLTEKMMINFHSNVQEKLTYVK